MKLAYADPPYFGCGHLYNDTEEASLREYDDLAAHARLIARLQDEYSDGWAMSLTSGSLHDILPLCPPVARIAAWVKPFASFKPNVSPAYTWEPVIFVRTRKHRREEQTVRDHLSQGITLQRGLTGVKPDAFNSWILDLLGWQVGDTLDDLFPGSGGMDRVIQRRSNVPADGELQLFGNEQVTA